MAIFVMLNNFFHDFAVAILFSALVIVSYLYKKYVNKDIATSDQLNILREIYTYLKRLIAIAWIVIIFGGIIRTVAYKEYEWIEAAGKGQITALIIKHILLVALVIWGIIIQKRLNKVFSK